jgi:hypothetical protein
VNFFDFLNRVFLYYPPETNEALTLETIYSDYSKALETGENYNFDEAFIQLLRTYKFRKTPTISDLLGVLNSNKIKSNEIKEISFNAWQGTIIATKSGIDYEFAIENGITFEEARQNLAKRGLTNIRKKPEPPSLVKFA